MKLILSFAMVLLYLIALKQCGYDDFDNPLPYEQYENK